MIIDYISDLHADFYLNDTNPQSPKFHLKIEKYCDSLLPEKIGDILIIAGDIGHYNQQTKFILKYFKTLYQEVLFVHGNHDLYLIGNQKQKYNYVSEDRVKELKEIAKDTNTFFLDGDIIEINNIKIGGTAGWYNLPNNEDIIHWRNSLNDSNLIFDGYPVYGAYSYGAMGRPDWDTQNFYLKEKEKLKKLECDVLVTHVAQAIPPRYAMNQRYVNDHGNIFYYVDNFDLVKQTGAKVYIYGHTHDIQEYEREDVKIYCNPLGYPSESRGKKIKQVTI